MVDREARERIASPEATDRGFETRFNGIKSLLRLILNAVLGLYATVIVLFVTTIIAVILRT